ncbi:MAG: septal ring lytic transglycosylase RlpA family protein [Saprospiraceae bacterium]|nr:septal ring lytic transglycosylase RlpA family protein [Saprospiraceae bacterium]
MTMKKIFAILILLGALCCTISAQEQVGKAAFYSNRYHGTRTYSGERYNKNAMTCAHKSLPMGTKLRVTCLVNNKSVVVRVNDRMSSTRTIIDLSRAAASKLGILKAGTANVKIEVISEEKELEESEKAADKTKEPDSSEGGN